MELDQIVHDFARAMEAADSRKPQAMSSRTPSRRYQPGIGPFAEDEAIKKTLTEMKCGNAYYLSAGKLQYPQSRQTCDLALGDPPDWAIEVKLARVGRDNGTYEDAAIKKILSPYADDRSAVTDCVKLAKSRFPCRRAVLIYGFEMEDRPLIWLIQAFEAVAASHARLGSRVEAPLRDLIHPVFNCGGVFAWELLSS